MPIPMLALLLLLIVLLVIAFALGGTLIASLISGGLFFKGRKKRKATGLKAEEEE
jgi:hypothetical protein